jgi:hypothetical protein
VLVVKYQHPKTVHTRMDSGDFDVTKVMRQVNT